MPWKNLFSAIFIIVLLFFSSPQARETASYTPRNKTPGEIFAYLEKAVELIKTKGVTAYDELTDPDGPWIKDDWYIFVNNFDGYNIAHPNKKMVDKGFFAIRDVKGIAFFAELLKEAKSDDHRGWVEFWWPKPGTTEPARKFGFVIGIPEKRIWVGTGAYDMSEEEIQMLKEQLPKD